MAAGEAPATTRTTYTKRVADVARQIRKQTAEIGKIVADVRAVQADTAAVAARLARASAAAVGLMEAAAAENPKDPAYRAVLRSLLRVQELFQGLGAATAAAGASENETRVLEARAEQLAGRKDARNTARLVADIGVVRAENAAAAAALGLGQ